MKHSSKHKQVDILISKNQVLHTLATPCIIIITVLNSVKPKVTLSSLVRETRKVTVETSSK